MALLVTFAPESHESPMGYYRRLASANRLDSWRDLASTADVSVSRTGLLGFPDHVAREFGLEETWTRALSHTEAQSRKLHRFQRGTFDAVCPDCLTESAYVRLVWDHVYYTVCSIHGRRMIDRCDQCGNRLSIHRPAIEYCECGRDLRLIPTAEGTAAQLWLSCLLEGSSNRRSIKPKIRNSDQLLLTHLIRVLCAHHVPDDASPRRNSTAPKTVGEAIEFLHPLDELLNDWPTGFRVHVKRRIEMADPNARTLNVALGSWYKLLKKYSIDFADRPFLDIVLDEASRSFDGVIGLDAAGLRGIQSDSPLSIKDVARRLGVSRDAVTAAIHSHQLKAHVRQFGERELMYSIPESELTRLEQSRVQWIDHATAMELLDVPESVLRNLVAAGVLISDANWKENIAKGGPISLSALQSLIVNVRDRIHHHVATDEKTIALSDINSRRIGDKRAIQMALQAMVSGDLYGVGKVPSHGIGSVMFRLSDVREFYATPILESGMTVDQLSKISGWKHESISHWILEGFLEAESIELRGQPSRVVLPEQLLRFYREYVPIADLARSLGTRSSALARRRRPPGFE